MSPPTDTEMLDWLISRGYAPALWREPKPDEAHLVRHDHPLFYAGPASRETVIEAMRREKERNAK